MNKKIKSLLEESSNIITEILSIVPGAGASDVEFYVDDMRDSLETLRNHVKTNMRQEMSLNTLIGAIEEGTGRTFKVAKKSKDWLTTDPELNEMDDELSATSSKDGVDISIFVMQGNVVVDIDGRMTGARRVFKKDPLADAAFPENLLKTISRVKESNDKAPRFKGGGKFRGGKGWKGGGR